MLVRLASAIWQPATWIAVAAFIAYLQPAVSVVQLNPDVVEYVDLGRRLAAGQGFLLGVKAYHFGGTEVLHDGLSERAPLYPLLVAGLFRLGVSLNGLQVVNAALAAGCVALIGGIGERLFGRRAGVISAVLAGASPVVLARMVPPMSEALSVGLVLLATWLLVRDHRGPKHYALAAGMVLGVAYLARPTALVAAGALVLGVLLTGPTLRHAMTGVAALVLGAALLIVPTVMYSVVTRGSLTYSGQTYLYSVFKDADVVRNGYVQPIPTAREFIAQNTEFVIGAIVDNVWEYGYLLFAQPDWLLPLTPGLVAVSWLAIRGRLPRVCILPVLVAASNFALYAATWSNYQERYQLLTLLLLMPFAVRGLEALGLDRLRLPGPLAISALHLAALAIVALWSPSFVREFAGEFRYGDDQVRSRLDAGLRWTGPPRWVQDNELRRTVEWIEDWTAPLDVVAHGQPWPYAFFTQRPATLLPTKLTDERLRSFLVEYRVAFVLLDTRDRDRRHYQQSLEELESAGVRSTPVGSLRVFDSRPLWR